MKKIYFLLVGMIVTIFAFVPNVLAEEGNDTQIDSAGDVIYEQQLDEGLLPEEEVVEFYREIPTNEQSLNDQAVPDLNNIKNDEITLFSRNPRWFAMSKSYRGLSYGPWLYAGASTLSGGRLSASHSSSISNTYSGSLRASAYQVESVVGFTITKGRTKSVTYTSNNLPKLSNKGHRLQYRHVYKKYSVRQERKYHSRSTTSYGTAYVYPRQWVERQYRVVTFNK